MRRRLFNSLSLLSLLLLLTGVALLGYARLRNPFASLRFVGPSRTYGISQWKGTVQFQVIGPFPSGYTDTRNVLWGSNPLVAGDTLGFSFTSGPCSMGRSPVPVKLMFLEVPAGFLILILAVMPLVALSRMLAGRRHRSEALAGGRGFEVTKCDDAP